MNNPAELEPENPTVPSSVAAETAEAAVEVVAASVEQPVSEVSPEPAPAEATASAETTVTLEAAPVLQLDDVVSPKKKKRRFSAPDFGVPAEGEAEIPTDQVSEPGAVAPLVSDEEYELKPTPLRRLLAAERRAQKDLDSKVSQLEDESAKSQSLAEAYKADASRLAEWHDQVHFSYIAKVKSRMQAEIARAESDLATHERNVQAIQILDEGTLVSLRKAFHKGLSRATRRLLYWVVPIILLALMPILPIISFLSDLYDKEKSWPWILLITGATIGLLIYARRFFGKEILTGKRIAKLSVFAFICITILALLPFISPWLLASICPWIAARIVGLILTFTFIFLVALTSLLLKYYSGWSTFRRQVQLQILQLRAVIEGYVKTQQEIQRLNLLYQQTTDWIEILANAVYRPWKTNPIWGSENEYAAHYETFPLAMRVAQAKEVNDAKMVALENNIARRLLIQGWRNKAFEDLVTQAGLEMGMDPERYNVELLDTDLPHQSNNSRALLKRFLDFSAQDIDNLERAPEQKPSASQSTVVDPSNRYLVEVAKERLLELIEKAQSEMFTTTRPRVQQIIDDELEGLRVDVSGVDTYDPSRDWDEFLRESLGGEALEEVPFGPLSFTIRGRSERQVSSPESYIMVPGRLADRLPPVMNSDKIKVVPFVDDKPRAVEIVARVDVAGPIPFDSFTVLGAGAAEPKRDSVDDTPKPVIGRDEL